MDISSLKVTVSVKWPLVVYALLKMRMPWLARQFIKVDR